MFILTMSCLARPYLVQKSSSKIESSKLFEQSSPMLNTIGLPTLPILRLHITGGTDDWQLMPTRASFEKPAVDGLGQGHRVGGVRVAGAGAGEHLVLGGGHAGDGLPAARALLGPGLEVRRERGVDVALVERPDQQRRHEAAVLAHLVDHVVARPREQDVLVDARRLVGLSHPCEEVLVGLGLPGAESGAGPGARRAALLAVDAVVEARAPPRGGTACRRRERARSRSRRAGRRSRSRRSRCRARR